MEHKRSKCSKETGISIEYSDIDIVDSDSNPGSGSISNNTDSSLDLRSCSTSCEASEESTDSCNTPFISMLEAARIQIPDEMKEVGTSFNINSLGKSRSYHLSSMLDLAMDTIRQAFFGSDEEKDEETLQKEQEVFVSKVDRWTRIKSGKLTKSQLMVNLKELLDGLKDRTPEERRPALSLIRNIKGVDRTVASVALGTKIGWREWL